LRKNNTPSVDPARLCVFEAAEAVRKAHERLYGSDALARLCRNLRPDKTRFAHALYNISTKRMLTLDHVVARISGRPTRSVPARLRQVLRQGACEILFMHAVPPYAAVDQAVRLAQCAADKRAAGFANAVLRRLAAAIESSEVPCPFEGGIAAAAGAESPLRTKAVPSSGDRWVVAKEDILPVSASSAGYLSAALSYPFGFARTLVEHFGLAVAAQIMAAGNEPAELFLRVNPLRTTGGELLRRLDEAGLAARLSDGPFVRLESDRRVEDLPGYSEGLFTVQDPFQAAVCRSLALREGDLVLDLCAAPGGKATCLAELSANSATIVAVDLSETRLRLALQSARRLGLSSVHCVVADALAPDRILARKADRVLLDVPCSNSAALRRRPEARWRLDARRIAALANQAGRMLKHAARAVAPGGALAYATCSILPRENERVVEAFLHKHPGFTQIAGELFVPEPGGPDGGFYAVLQHTR